MRRVAPIVAAALLCCLVISTACTPAPSGGPPRNAPGEVTSLDGVEVREYEGADLSSVSDFRENSIAGPQVVDERSYRLNVKGLVGKAAEYTYSEIASGYPAYKKVVTLDCVEGWSVTILWEGVLVRDILEQADAQPEATTVILHAVDGYTTMFPLEYFYENDILLAYSMNGVTLPAERGFPFQLVAEDKWGYKWIKWVTEIELSADETYRGYWESRGYSDSGDRDKNYFDGN